MCINLATTAIDLPIAVAWGQSNFVALYLLFILIHRRMVHFLKCWCCLGCMYALPLRHCAYSFICVSMLWRYPSNITWGIPLMWLPNEGKDCRSTSYKIQVHNSSLLCVRSNAEIARLSSASYQCRSILVKSASFWYPSKRSASSTSLENVWHA